MQIIGVFEAKAHFSALLEQVEQGKQILITRHGHPVARLVPANDEAAQEKAIAIQALKNFAQTYNVKLNGVDWKELCEQGRK